MLEEKGVEFHLNAGVKEIVQEEGKVGEREREGEGGREKERREVGREREDTGGEDCVLFPR